MRHVGSWNRMVLLLALLAAGCRLPYREGPVPQSVADCRRLSQQGVTALDRGQQEKAETLLVQAVTAWPVDPEARRHYAEALWRRNARQEAIVQMEEASRLAGDDAALLTRLAEMYIAENKVDLARQYVERAISLDPKLASAWTVRGRVMQAAGRPQEALADYLRALNYAPKDQDLLLAVAGLYQQQQEPERALQTLQSAAELYLPDEEPVQILSSIGQAYGSLGRYDEAVECLSTVVRRGKATPEVLSSLGEMELLAGHPVEAAAAARQALAIQPQHQPSRDLLNRIELAQQPGAAARR